jgi:hypothetical protein
MAQYLQLEKRTSGQVDTGDPVVFNVQLQSGGGGITYNDLTGVITFALPGVYYLNWYVAQQTGLATDGSNFDIVTSNAVPDIVGSNHVKISQTSGFAIIETTTAGVTARLVNVADERATLSDTTMVKAALAVFGIPEGSGEPPALGYLQAQVTDEYLTIDPFDPVVFDAVISDDPYEIVTTDGTEFILANPGTYLVNWHIPLDATDTEGFAGFTLTLNTVPHSSMRIPVAIGVVYGSALVEVTEDDSILTLANSYDDIIRITEQATIVITQISDGAPPEPEPEP